MKNFIVYFHYTQRFKRWSVLVLIILILGYSSGCHSSDYSLDSNKEDIAFAGFALVGSNDHLSSKFPHTKQLENEIQSRLITLSKNITPQHYNLVTKQYLDADKGATKAIALTLDEERVVIEKHDDDDGEFYRLEIFLAAQATVFDFNESEKSIIAVYPLQIHSYRDVYKDYPDEKILRELIYKLYFGGLINHDREKSEESPVGSIIDEFLNVLIHASIKDKHALEVGIGTIDFREGAFDDIQQPKYQSNPKILKEILARQLARSLYLQKNISVIPKSVDNAVAQMALRFTGEKSAYFYSLPKADYLIDISVRKLKSVIVKNTSAGARKAYFSVVRFGVRYGYNDDLIFNRNLIGEHQLADVVGVDIDEWNGYEWSIKTVIYEFISNIFTPQRGWIKIQQLNKPEVKQLKTVKEVLEKCG